MTSSMQPSSQNPEIEEEVSHSHIRAMSVLKPTELIEFIRGLGILVDRVEEASSEIVVTSSIDITSSNLHCQALGTYHQSIDHIKPRMTPRRFRQSSQSSSLRPVEPQETEALGKRMEEPSLRNSSSRFHHLEFPQQADPDRDQAQMKQNSGEDVSTAESLSKPLQTLWDAPSILGSADSSSKADSAARETRESSAADDSRDALESHKESNTVNPSDAFMNLIAQWTTLGPDLTTQTVSPGES